MKVLVTRPAPGAAATARELRRLGFEPVLAPCLEIERLAADLPERPAALLITSAQAIPALPSRLRDIPSFCVGDATAERLRQAGFTAVESAGGNARDLARLVAARRVAGLHLLAAGAGAGLELAAGLRRQGVQVTRREVYAARPAPALAPDVRAALAAGEIEAALFYSAASAGAFVRLRPEGTARMQALALSQAVASACEPLPWREIRVASVPDEKQLMVLLKS